MRSVCYNDVGLHVSNHSISVKTAFGDRAFGFNEVFSTHQELSSHLSSELSRFGTGSSIALLFATPTKHKTILTFLLPLFEGLYTTFSPNLHCSLRGCELAKDRSLDLVSLSNANQQDHSFFSSLSVKKLRNISDLRRTFQTFLPLLKDEDLFIEISLFSNDVKQSTLTLIFLPPYLSNDPIQEHKKSLFALKSVLSGNLSKSGSILVDGVVQRVLNSAETKKLFITGWFDNFTSNSEILWYLSFASVATEKVEEKILPEQEPSSNIPSVEEVDSQVEQQAEENPEQLKIVDSFNDQIFELNERVCYLEDELEKKKENEINLLSQIEEWKKKCQALSNSHTATEYNLHLALEKKNSLETEMGLKTDSVIKDLRKQIRSQKITIDSLQKGKEKAEKERDEIEHLFIKTKNETEKQTKAILQLAQTRNEHYSSIVSQQSSKIEFQNETLKELQKTAEKLYQSHILFSESFDGSARAPERESELNQKQKKEIVALKQLLDEWKKVFFELDSVVRSKDTTKKENINEFVKTIKDLVESAVGCTSSYERLLLLTGVASTQQNALQQFSSLKSSLFQCLSQSIASLTKFETEISLLVKQDKIQSPLSIYNPETLLNTSSELLSKISNSEPSSIFPLISSTVDSITQITYATTFSFDHLCKEIAAQ